VVLNWADDSVGIGKASSDSTFISRATGLAVSRGEADATAEEYHWRTDFVCYSLFRAFNHHGYQASWYLPEQFGQCM